MFFYVAQFGIWTSDARPEPPRANSALARLDRLFHRLDDCTSAIPPESARGACAADRVGSILGALGAHCGKYVKPPREYEHRRPALIKYMNARRELKREKATNNVSTHNEQKVNNK